MWYHALHRRRALPDRRHVVADRDRRPHDHAAARASPRPSRARPPSPSRASTVEVVDDDGQRSRARAAATSRSPARGRRCCAGIWGDPERYRETYWSRYEGRYFAGDGAKIDDDGYFWLLGRVDDVMNVSGHRVSTTEVESALVDHPAVAEAAVVGATDATTGQAIIGYVILRGGYRGRADELVEEIRQHVATKIGPTARPKAVVVVPDLPKTRSGKIMRRLLPRRGRGPRPRRHHHAGRRRRGRRDPRAQGRGLRRRRTDAVDRSRPRSSSDVLSNWRWRDGRTVAPGTGRRVRHGRRAVRRRRPPALPRWPVPRLGGVLRGLRRRPLIDEVARLLEVIDPELHIVLLTARPIRVQPQTLAWLDRYELRWDLLIMRDYGDYGASREFKRRTVAELRAYGFDLRLAFEDDRRNYHMFHAEGVPCVYIHSGYYDESMRVWTQSRKFSNCRGIPKSASLSAAMTACRSSRFLPVTRT